MHRDECLKDQIDFLLGQWRAGVIKDVHQFMTLLDMIYKDYLEFHPEEHPINDKPSDTEKRT